MHGEAFARDPGPAYARLRAAGPAAWAELAPSVLGLVVTDYQAALEVLTNPAVFSKDARRWEALVQGQVPPDSPVLAMMAPRPSLLYADGDDHTRLRWAMEDCLARVNAHQVRAVTRTSARSLIARIAPTGRADLMGDYADTVPLLVFAHLLGCPTETSGRMVAACQGMINAGPDAPKASADLVACLGETARLKQDRPGQDVTSWMLAHPAQLSIEEVIHQLVVVIGAGTIPTAAWIAQALLLLLSDDDYAGSLAGGTASVTRALEKVLWLRSPMANFSVHYARHATRLRGVHIPQGVPVLISHAAANTDPTLPDVGYANRSHLAWSAGPHRCPATGLASIIAETAIETILDRLWDMALDKEKTTNRHGPFHQCPAHVPVHFAPKPSHAAPVGGTA
ncbi:cytochrome P450 [Streptomyces sp. NPDC059506]|uniref:cytochrome P450 n=1 Tax=Streptomyces sp. NPDC059506 TaxID=3347751 RepID=UPI00367FE438